MKKKLLASVLLAASLVTLGAVSAARAEPLPFGTTILETVDGVTSQTTTSIGNVLLRVEGIIQGETEPRELDLVFSGSTTNNGPAVQERCLKFMLIAQSRPGHYSIELKTSSATSVVISSCKLKSR